MMLWYLYSFVSPPTTLITHVQGHIECHKRVKRSGQGQWVVEIALKLQGPMCTKLWSMCVFPDVVVVLIFLGLSPNHPHHTCARPYRKSSKSQKMGPRAMGCGYCPKATRPHVHKIMVHVCLPKCCCGTCIPWSLPQPPSSHMCKAI